MFEKKNGRKFLRCLIFSLLVCVLVLTPVTLAKYVFDFSLPSFTIKIKPAEKITLPNPSSNYGAVAKEIVAAASGKGTLWRVVFDYWDLETGYTDASNDVTITDWNETGSVALGSTNGGVRMFVRPNKDNSNRVTVYVLSPSKMYAPKDSKSFFSYYAATGFVNVREIFFTNLHMTDVTTCNRIFYGNSSLYNSSLSAFADKLAESNVTNLALAFYGCKNMNTTTFNKIISALNGKQVTTFAQTFASCTGLSGNLDLSTVNMRNVTTLYGIFNACSQITGLVLPETTDKLTDMSSMVNDCINLKTIDLSKLNTSKVTNMGDDSARGTFQGCSALTTIWIGDNWSTSSVKTSENMFLGCKNLVGEKETPYSSSHVDKTYARRDGGPDSATPGYLTHINAFSNQMDLSLSTKEKFDDYYADILADFKDNFDDENVNDDIYDQMQAELDNLAIGGNGYDAWGRFALDSVYEVYCKYMSQVSYPVEKMLSPAGAYITYNAPWTHEVVFTTLSNYEEIKSPHITIDLPLDDYGSGAVRLSFDEGMFSDTGGTLYFIVDDRYFDTMIAPESLSGFFQGFTALKEVHFNGLLDVSGVTDFSNMFAGCNQLEAIYVCAGEDWSIINAADTGMFDGCTSLTGGSGTIYDPARTGLAYAHIDGGTDNPGYFTEMAS